VDTRMPSRAGGKEQRRYCSLYGSAAGGIKSSTIDCSATGIKEGTGRTAASALDKISEQVICILSGEPRPREVADVFLASCIHCPLSLLSCLGSLKRCYMQVLV
jgi:hypothetical protein